MSMFAKPALLSLLLLGACATGSTAPSSGEAGAASAETAIPFVSSDGILDWKAVGQDTLYIQGSDGRWFLVRTTGPCTRLGQAMTLGFVTSGVDQLDRFGAILAQGQRCQITSVTRAAGPPPGELRHGSGRRRN
jgi:hypothetical protein